MVPDEDMAMDFMPTKREKLQQLANYLNANRGLDEHLLDLAIYHFCKGFSMKFWNLV